VIFPRVRFRGSIDFGPEAPFEEQFRFDRSFARFADGPFERFFFGGFFVEGRFGRFSGPFTAEPWT